jgi:Cu/Ag efflux pump CusA
MPRVHQTYYLPLVCLVAHIFGACRPVRELYGSVYCNAYCTAGYIGAFLSLWLFDQTFNIFSQIGIITLVGLVTKNGILIVEFANQRMEHGLSKYEAVVEAATSRLRPILMTSLAVVLGSVPIALLWARVQKAVYHWVL